jgi:large subunit ribosomal protein L21
MSYAIIETGGKQYRVSPGDVITVEQLEVDEGDSIAFDKVLMYQNSQNPVIGNPFVEGAVVTAEVAGQLRGPKVRVFTYKPKKRQRRTLGHRQMVTEVKILEIKVAGEGSSKAEKAEKAVKAEKVVKTPKSEKKSK